MPSATAQCHQTPKEPAVKVFDSDGDLLLKVGTIKCVAPRSSLTGTPSNDAACTFQVCSRAMARASSVWKRMLFGGFAESKPKEGEWVVRLPDDSPEAMSTLLSIVHADFDAVPLHSHRLATHNLFELTVLTDKYDLTHIMKPWARTWLELVWDMAGYNFTSNLQLLWITWELGDQIRFASTASFLAQHMKNRKTLECSMTPPEVAGKFQLPFESEWRNGRLRAE